MAKKNEVKVTVLGFGARAFTAARNKNNSTYFFAGRGTGYSLFIEIPFTPEEYAKELADEIQGTILLPEKQ